MAQAPVTGDEVAEKAEGNHRHQKAQDHGIGHGGGLQRRRQRTADGEEQLPQPDSRAQPSAGSDHRTGRPT